MHLGMRSCVQGAASMQKKLSTITGVKQNVSIVAGNQTTFWNENEANLSTKLHQHVPDLYHYDDLSLTCLCAIIY